MATTLDQLNHQNLIPVEGMLDALAHRWSPRSFRAVPVPIGDLKIVLEAARWAASSSNLQPWRFLVGVKGTETYDKIFATLVPFNQSWAGNAGVLILGFALAKDPKGNVNRFALHDLGQALAQLTVQAAALGLVTHSMGGFDTAAAQEAFGLTEDHVIGAVTALGYQDEPTAIANDQMREREVAPRERKPLSEIALSALDKPLTI